MSNRFQQLRQRQDQGLLSEAEQAELAQLTQELETAEARYLAPAADRMWRERATIEAQNRALESLEQSKAALVHRLRAFVAESLTERRAIERELAGVLGGPHGSPSDE